MTSQGAAPARQRRHPRSRRPALDATDYAILDLLQKDASRSDAEIARRVGLSASGCRKRLEKLEQGQVLTGRIARIDRHSVGLGLLCFVQVTLTHHRRGPKEVFTHRIGELDEVLECHFLTGEHDYLLKVVATDNRHLERILAEDLASIPGVDRLRTSIVLNEVKGTSRLPLPSQTGDSAIGPSSPLSQTISPPGIPTE